MLTDTAHWSWTTLSVINNQISIKVEILRCGRLACLAVMNSVKEQSDLPLMDRLKEISIRYNDSTSSCLMIKAGLTYLGRVCTVLLGPPHFFTVKSDLFSLFLVVAVSIHFSHTSMTNFSMARQFSHLPGGGASNVVEPHVHVHTVHLG